MNQTRFLDAAERAGIAQAAAQVLYRELYPRAHPLAAGQPAYAEQGALPRLVQTLLYAGALLVIGSHAWWARESYDASGFGAVLAITLGYMAAFAAAGEL